MVLLAYSNPESGGVLGNDSSFLNALCFVLPLVALVGERRTEPELIAAFSSKMMTALTRGLYIEDGEVKYDLLEDFDRVWTPIHTQLWPGDEPPAVSTEDLSWLDEVEAPFKEYLDTSPESRYLREFISFLPRMARDRELIRNAVES